MTDPRLRQIADDHDALFQLCHRLCTIGTVFDRICDRGKQWAGLVGKHGEPTKEDYQVAIGSAPYPEFWPRWLAKAALDFMFLAHSLNEARWLTDFVPDAFQAGQEPVHERWRPRLRRHLNVIEDLFERLEQWQELSFPKNHKYGTRLKALLQSASRESFPVFDVIWEPLDEFARDIEAALPEFKTKSPGRSPRETSDLNLGLQGAELDNLDRKLDKQPKTKKQRPITKEALDCARRYKLKLRGSDKTSMDQVVKDYVEENGGSFSSIRRVLSDHPERWKSST